jgi:hypothetical protein
MASAKLNGMVIDASDDRALASSRGVYRDRTVLKLSIARQLVNSVVKNGSPGPHFGHR